MIIKLKIFLIILIAITPICILWVKGIDKNKDIKSDDVEFP